MKDMASGIPPTGLFTDTIATGPGSLEYVPPPPPMEANITMTTEGVERRSGMRFLGAAIIAIWAIIVGLLAVSQGAPGFFMLFAILIAIIGIASAIASGRQQERLAQQKAAAELDAQERLRKEIAEAVKDSIKSNIKVRCRYCGSLTDETATKCDSCGATL